MEKIKVYDLPTRLFHWIFVCLFACAYAITQLIDDESPLFSQHMLLGLILACITSLRVIWGFMGTKFALFSSFPLHPIRLLEYFRNILSSKGPLHLGHNPASAWAALIMIALALGLGVTGFLMSTGDKETYEDTHELLANAFALVAIAHIIGVALHQLRHRDGIALSMIHGKKESTGINSGIISSHRFVALGMAGVVGLFAFHIYRNYDAAQSTTSVFGVKLQLGERESEGSERKLKNSDHEEIDD